MATTTPKREIIVANLKDRITELAAEMAKCEVMVANLKDRITELETERSPR